MCYLARLLLFMPALLAAQTPSFDDGRLDPAWFGPEVVFQPSRALGFQWLKSGQELRGRTIHLRAWEPAAWLVGRRSAKDRTFLDQVEATLPVQQEKGIRRGLKAALAVSTASGGLQLVARVVDAEGVGDDYMAIGSYRLSFDMKLVEGASGELLGAFHGTLRGPNPDVITTQFERWCEDLGRLLSTAATPPPLAKAAQPAPVSAAPVLAAGRPAVPAPAATQPGPSFDLERALHRIEGLKQDGLLSEEEYLSLRKKAAAKAR
jgi:hypothetical protein